ncbi:MAG: hypothetical protein RR138_06795, partial [Akkermansia sp.]
ADDFFHAGGICVVSVSHNWNVGRSAFMIRFSTYHMRHAFSTFTPPDLSPGFFVPIYLHGARHDLSFPFCLLSLLSGG